MLAVPIIASVLLALLLTFHAADDQCRIDATKTKPVAQYMLSGVLMRRRDEGQILHILVARFQVNGGRELLMPECQYGKNTLYAAGCAQQVTCGGFRGRYGNSGQALTEYVAQ